VLAARELEPAVAQLAQAYGLGEPYRDPGVGQFGLANAVFAIGDTFLEVVCPVDPDVPGASTAARQLERAGGGLCGYMAMLQVEDLAAARERTRRAGVREVLSIEFDDVLEVHLHPADMRGAIVALTEPRPAESWRWGGEGWRERSVPGAVTGIEVATREPAATEARWSALAGAPIEGCRFVPAKGYEGIVAVELEREGRPAGAVELGQGRESA
jgi:hypothetical protein